MRSSSYKPKVTEIAIFDCSFEGLLGPCWGQVEFVRNNPGHGTNDGGAQLPPIHSCKGHQDFEWKTGFAKGWYQKETE